MEFCTKSAPGNMVIIICGSIIQLLLKMLRLWNQQHQRVYFLVSCKQFCPHNMPHLSTNCLIAGSCWILRMIPDFHLPTVVKDWKSLWQDSTHIQVSCLSIRTQSQSCHDVENAASNDGFTLRGVNLLVLKSLWCHQWKSSTCSTYPKVSAKLPVLEKPRMLHCKR